jgi:hypothetical protein
MKHFDTIGDVHGQAGKLERLFRVLGYEKIGGVYGSAGRKAVFVGDLNGTVVVYDPIERQQIASGLVGKQIHESFGYLLSWKMIPAEIHQPP